MRKITQRIVSAVLFASMMFSSVFTGNVTAGQENGFEKKDGVMYIRPVIEGRENTDDESVSPELIGSTVNIDFYLEQNPGFSSATFYLKYDPDVIRAKCGNIPKGQADLDGYVTYTYYLEAVGQDITSPLFANSKINSQIAYVPAKSAAAEFEGADGVKTAAQLGKIKFAGMVADTYVDENNHFKAIEGDGKLFSMTFDVIGEGDADIYVDIVKFGYPPVASSASSSEMVMDPIPVENYPNGIFVGSETTT